MGILPVNAQKHVIMLIAQESEQKGKLESMLDLNSTSVCEECTMVCRELQYKDVDEDQIVY